jgi:hypothetical protein
VNYPGRFLNLGLLLISIYTVQLFEKLVKTNEEVNEANVQYVEVVLDLQKPRVHLAKTEPLLFKIDVVDLITI